MKIFFCDGIPFAELSAAKAHAEKLFQERGIVAGVEAQSVYVAFDAASRREEWTPDEAVDLLLRYIELTETENPGAFTAWLDEMRENNQ